jgi:uncharacterized protein (TIGR00304 family)
MQSTLLLNLGWILLFVGILLVCVYAFSGMQESFSSDTESKTQSKGVILLGPIPIVWGYGKRGWMIAGILAIVLLLVWIAFFM